VLSRYDQLRKLRATMPLDPGEAVPAERAITDERMQAQREAFARREQALDRGEPPANPCEADIDRAILFARRQRAERTQSKPTENAPGEAGSRKCAVSRPAPATKRTHGDPAGLSPPARTRARPTGNVTTPPPSATHIA
jgi:hypothetical protein